MLWMGMLAGCGLVDGSSGHDSRVDDLQHPTDGGRLQVEPSSLNFGQVSAEDFLQATGTLQLKNVGDDTLILESVTVDEPVFQPGETGQVALAPGESTELAVTFAPDTAGAWQTELRIATSDPTSPESTIGLLGTGIAPVFLAEPLDFGSGQIGCERSVPITVSNLGDADLEITQLEADGDELVFNPTDLPWTIPPAGSLDVWVSHHPIDALPDLATATLLTNDPLNLEAQLVASGEGAGEEMTDTWTQPAVPVIDILIAPNLDMDAARLGAIRTELDTLLMALQATHADYHLGIVSQDSGCLAGGQWTDSDDSDAEQTLAFEQMLAPTQGGDNADSAFLLLLEALSDDNQAGCNAGFYRDDAALALMGISDEAEGSFNTYIYYLSWLQAIKSDYALLSVYAVGGDYPSGCEDADWYTDLYEATVATDGSFWSICTAGWGAEAVSMLEVPGVDPARFELGEEPVVETLEVRLDGVVQETGWSWSEDAVFFDEAPGGDVEISVSYFVMGECPEGDE